MAVSSGKHCETFLKRQREEHEIKVKQFASNTEQDYIRKKYDDDDDDDDDDDESREIRTVDPNDAHGVKKWVDAPLDDDDEDEYNKRRAGLLDSYQGSVRLAFDYLRYLSATTASATRPVTSSITNITSSSTSSRQENEQEEGSNSNPDAFSGGGGENVAAVSKHLQVLLHDIETIFGHEDGSWCLRGCLAGSLLLTDIEKNTDEMGNAVASDSTNMWTIMGYDKTFRFIEIFKTEHMMDQNTVSKHLPSRDAMEKSRIPPPPGATKLSRFSESAETIGQSYGGGILREARCVVTAYEQACNGIDVDGDILALSGSTGYKYRSPWFGAQTLKVPIVSMANNDDLIDLDEMNEVQTGFYDPGCNVVCSQQLRTVAFKADERIKLFDVDTTMNRRSSMPCKATLQAKNCTAPVFVDTNIVSISTLQNKDKQIHMWRVGDLQKHTPLTLADVQDFSDDDSDDDDESSGHRPRWLDLQEQSWNDDVMESPENIDVNRGEAPHVTSSIQGLSNNSSPICSLEKIKSTPNNNTICIGTRDDASLFVVDVLESKMCAHLLGHLSLGGSDLKMSTSAGSPNLLMSTRGDQHARIWDLRCPTVPVLTLHHATVDGMRDCCCMSEDMIAFTSAAADQCVRAWDLRAPACLYKLSSGNTEVTDLSYSTDTKTLFAIAHGSNTDRYFPDGYFPHAWNAYTQRGLMAMQHRTECSHVITYQFKEEMDVNENMPINRERREDPNEYENGDY